MSASLQKVFDASLDEFVGKFGLVRATLILRNHLTDQRSTIRQRTVVEAVAFLKLEACYAFGLRPDDFLTSTEQPYKDARMCCYYLFRQYYHLPYGSIGASWGQSRRHVRHYCYKMTEIMEAPRFYRDVVTPFLELEKRFVRFIGKVHKT